jgi:hypothetical protein
VAFPGPDAARFLNVHAPGCGFGAFVRALAAAGGDPALAAARTPFDEQEG